MFPETELFAVTSTSVACGLSFRSLLENRVSGVGQRRALRAVCFDRGWKSSQMTLDMKELLKDKKT